MSAPKQDRVHKLIAQAGLMSRRKAEEAILAGRVSVNGEVLTELGRVVDSLVDVITVDGFRVEFRAVKRTYLFYKPRGVITSKGDPQGRMTVMDFFKDDPSLNPVGRLDFESEGLLLLTHDGDLALKLTHPRYGVKKVYEVEVAGEIPEEFLQEVVTEVQLEDGPGKFEEICEIEVTLVKENSANIESASGLAQNSIKSLFISRAEAVPTRNFLVTVSEGRNRFIRRMIEHFGLQVMKLKRVQLGDYQLGDLKPGERVEVS